MSFGVRVDRAIGLGRAHRIRPKPEQTVRMVSLPKQDNETISLLISLEPHIFYGDLVTASGGEWSSILDQALAYVTQNLPLVLLDPLYAPLADCVLPQ